MRRILTAALATALMLHAGPASPHAGREFVIAYAAGESAPRTLAHVLGMVAVDRLGFDVRILSLPAAEIPARVRAGTVSLAVVTAGTAGVAARGWRPAAVAKPPADDLWGSYDLDAAGLRLLVPAVERADLRFDAVAKVLGDALTRLDLAFFTSLGTIPLAEGRLSGPLRTALEERGIL